MAYDPADWDTADDTAKDTAQHFFTDPDGAHITTTAGDPDAGDNVLIDSSGMYVREGTVNKAQFTDPVIVGKTSTGEANIRIGNIPNWSDGVGIFTGSTIGLLLQGTGSSGTINSGMGCYLVITDGIGITPPLQTPFNVLDSNRQSDFCIGGFHVYSGTIVPTVAASQGIVIWSPADFCARFNVDTTTHAGYCWCSFENGDLSAQNHRVISTNFHPSTGWSARLDSAASAGAFRFNYLVVVPDSYSTV